MCSFQTEEGEILTRRKRDTLATLVLNRTQRQQCSPDKRTSVYLIWLLRDYLKSIHRMIVTLNRKRTQYNVSSTKKSYLLLEIVSYCICSGMHLRLLYGLVSCISYCTDKIIWFYVFPFDLDNMILCCLMKFLRSFPTRNVQFTSVLVDDMHAYYLWLLCWVLGMWWGTISQ